MNVRPRNRAERPQLAHPLSISITEDQLAWIDQRRAQGSISRSACLRMLLDDAMLLERRRVHRAHRAA